MSKRIKLVDIRASSGSSEKSTATTNWDLCVLCQKDTSESLTSPAHSKRQDVGKSYKALAENLKKFDELGSLPRSLKLDRMDQGEGIEAAMIINEAKWHQSCKLCYNNNMLKRAEKRSNPTAQATESYSASSKRIGLRKEAIPTEATCFFCGNLAGPDGLHEASTFQLDKRVRESATLIEDSLLLGKLSMGDMVALEAKYHTKCLLALYNRARKFKADASQGEPQMSGIALAELAMYIEETRLEASTAPVFKLADLVHLYTSRLEQLGIVNHTRVNSTRLKLRLLAQFPDMRAHSQGRDIWLAFDNDVGIALDKACEQDSDSDAVVLARAAQIVRQQMFEDHKVFNGSFGENCQQESVPQLLLALVNMVLEGPSIKDQIREFSTQAALSIAQVLQFNSVKHARSNQTDTPLSVKHSIAQETPIPTYIGLMLHAHTRKRELVDKFFHLGLSISYDRVQRLSAEMGNSVCQRFYMEQVVCPPTLRGSVFTTSAVDNIDHNPSSTTATDSFHGTAISLLQHPSCADQGVDLGAATIRGNAISRTISPLPSFYTDVPPVTSVKLTAVPATSMTSLRRTNFKKHREGEYKWLENTRLILEESGEKSNNLSWAAYHAGNQNPTNRVLTATALLPLFKESAHSVAMIRHSIDVIKSAVEHLNPGQTPVVTFDQPLFTLAKQIQWKWPEKYGEDKLVVMFGGLHIEMIALKTLGDWLKGSGWSQALVQAEIVTAGTADSLCQASHVLRTRRAHQITATALYILQHRAYSNYTSNCQAPVKFESWCDQRKEICPQFKYWATTLELELCVLTYVRSLREADFDMYLDALTELAPWFFALNHTNYSRWIPVHLRDMAELPKKHPEVHRQFSDGHFTVQKTKRVFSAIPIDQAHEQNNARIKGDGGAVGLTEDPSALRRWMIAGPEVSRAISEFENLALHWNEKEDIHHHDQTASTQAAFAKHVHSLVAVLEEFGNPFEEESQDLLVLDTKEIADSAVVETVRNVKEVGQEQFEAFTKECIKDRTKSLHDTIHRNKLPLFSTTNRKVSRGKQQLISLKSDVQLFSRLYIGCQTRDGNLDEFFRHENQACPPSLSDAGRLHLGSKSDLLVCLESLCEGQTTAPSVTSLIIDGAAVVQMITPGAAKTFQEYANQVFLPYISGQFQCVSRLDLVWDCYKTDSLKATARAKRGKGIRRRVIGSAPIPGNWQNFLRVDLNKQELFTFLSNSLIQKVDTTKVLVVTDGEQAISVPPQDDLQSLSPCSHEEADSRMMLHAAHAVQHGHQRVLIRTVDTDVVVLAVMVSQMLPADAELWLAFGTGKSLRYLAAHEISTHLGPEKSLALPMFHALSGCDTVSAFVGHGKKSAWNTWNSLPELTGALLALSHAPSDIPEEARQTIERFVILMYDRTSTSTDINKARKKLFTKKSSVLRIPPTKAALEQHIRRATFQGGHIWGQTLLPQPSLPSPCSWGWTKTNGLYEPYWTTLPEASKTCYELVSCGCKKGCIHRCKCKNASLQCTALCQCEGECSRN